MKPPWLGLVVALGLVVTGCARRPPAHEETGAHPATTLAHVIAAPPPANTAIGLASDPIRVSLSIPADDRVVQLAMRHVGRPYVWGGASPDGFDCSGFVMYVYARLGIALPHNAARQYAHGAPVGRDQLRPGDLVFFDRLRHNGIYIGAGQFVHASKRGSGVKISRLDESWFRERWLGARRLLPAGAP